MDFGLTMPTHGLLMRDERDFYLQKLPASEMRPVEVAKLAERPRLPLRVVLRPRLHGPGRGRVPHGEHVGDARLSEPADDARHDRDDGRDRRRDEHDPDGVVRLDRALSPPARGRTPARDRGRALGRPPDRRDRERLGSAGVRRRRRRLRAPRLRHRGADRDLQARLERAVPRLPRPLLRDPGRIARAQAGAAAASADRLRSRHRRGRAPGGPHLGRDLPDVPRQLRRPAVASSICARPCCARRARIGRDVSDFRMYAFCSGLWSSPATRRRSARRA